MNRAERRTTWMAGVALGLVLLPGLARAQDIQTDFDRAYDFGKLKTYAYAAEGRRMPNDPLAANSINDKRVRAALDSQLTTLGYAPAAAGKADFLVAYNATTRTRRSLQGFGYGPTRWAGGRIDVQEQTEGTLIVDLVDAGTNTLFWRGSASGTLQPKDAEKKIKGAVGKLMKQYAKETRPRSS